jgi:uncharacterized radical SAM superfamily Fe-S cluster-containing enzyme
MSFLKKKTIPTGRYSYRGTDKFAGMSFQLRVEVSGQGVMVINGDKILHLNHTATALAYFFMQGLPEKDVVKKIRGMYRVNAETAKADYEKLVYTVSTLAQTTKIDPVSFLEIEKMEPFSYQYSAPLRMDLALTFRCQNDCVHCYAGGPHETPELTTIQWKSVIDKLSEIGVFILTFTGGEPTLREDLPELLLYAQNKGMVTGLISNGRKLKDKAFVDLLEKSGLDFVQLTLESHKPQVHDLMQTQRRRLLDNHRLHKRAGSKRVWLQQPHLLGQSTIYKRRIRPTNRRIKHSSPQNPRQSPHDWLKVPLVHANAVLPIRPCANGFRR